MNDICQELFEEWSIRHKLCLDQIFMSTDEIPLNPYKDTTTRCAYDVWKSGFDAGQSLHETKSQQSVDTTIKL